MSNLVNIWPGSWAFPTMSNLVTNLTTFLTEISSRFADDIIFILASLAVNGPVLGRLGIMSYLVCCVMHDV